MQNKNILLFSISLFVLSSGLCYGQPLKLVLPVGHTARINTAVFSPNGKKILTASDDKTAKIWDVFTGYLLVNLQVHFGYVLSAEFSPSCENDINGGSKIVTASIDKTARIWDAVSGELLKELKGHDSTVYTAHFSTDGKKIITASADRTAKIWDAVTGELLKEFKGVSSADFDSAGMKVLSFLPGGSALVWNALNGEKLCRINLPGLRLYNAIFSPDGKRILTTWDDGNGRLYDAFSGILKYTLPNLSPKNMETYSSKKPYNVVKKTASRDHTAIFSPDGRKIVSLSNEGTVKCWNAVSGALIFSKDFKIYFTHIPSVEFSPDGKKILFSVLKEKMMFPVMDDSGIDEGGISKIIDAGTGKLLSSLVLPVTAWTSGYYAHFSPACPEDPSGGKKILTVANQVITVWDQYLKEKPAVLKGYSVPASSVMFSAMSPLAENIEGAIISSYNHPGLKSEVYQFWDIHTGNLRAPKTIDTSGVTYLKFSKTGEKMATVSSLGVTIWDVSSGKKIIELKRPFGERGEIYFSDGAERLAILEEEGKLSIWNLKTGMLINLLTETEATFGLIFDEIEWSPDGNKIITFRRNLNQSAKVWDVNTGKILFRIKEPVNYSKWSMQFSWDSKWIVNASEGGTVKIWGAARGNQKYELRGITSVSSVYFSPDGTKLVTASEDGTLNIWNAANGDRLLNLPGHSGNLKNYPRINVFAQFSPRCADDTSGGRYIISYTNEDAVIKIWDAGNGKPLTELKGHSDGINDARFSPDGKYIVSSSSDNTIKKWDAATGKCIYTFISFNKDEYLKQIAGGYYEGTPGITRLLHYVTSDSKVISFDQLDVKYNRPDKVLEAIGKADTALISMYRNAYYKRIKKLGIDTTSFRDGYSVPETDFVNRNEIIPEQTNETFSLHIKGKDSTYKLDRFNVWVNEVPVFGQRGISIRNNNSNGLDTILTIRLSQGENRIETSVTNVNGTESYRMPLIVKYTPADTQKETTYFIGIGIDKFADASYDLQYSSKDIRDLSVKLKAKFGRHMIIDTLFNENVTVNNVKALKQKLLQTTVNDRVIISYSGHGLLSKAFDYYLSTYRVNFDTPEENGLPYDELENLLDSIPARKKLLLIDACHSGEVDKEEYEQATINKEALDSNHIVSRGVTVTSTKMNSRKIGLKNSFELMQNIFVNVGKSTGATVISAAAGTELALEKGDLKNGVFTYCVMEAMDNYPTMKISEFKKSVGARVEVLTKGMQKPTSRNEAISVDWKVW